MSIDFKINNKGIDLVNDAITLGVVEMMSEMAQEQILNIRDRCKAGLNVKDSKMPPYSKGTKRRRERAQRQTAKRDLLFTGKMLRSISASEPVATDNGFEVTLSFSTREEAVKAAYNQKIDEWFGVSPKDAEKLKESLEARAKQLIEGKG